MDTARGRRSTRILPLVALLALAITACATPAPTPSPAATARPTPVATPAPTLAPSPSPVVVAGPSSIVESTVVDAMTADRGGPLTELRVDGGAARNDDLLRFQADILGIPVERPRVTETTA